MSSTPRAETRTILLDGERYDLVPANQATGSRAWKGGIIGSQEASAEQEQAIALDFVNGGGFTFQGLPGTYERAHRWAAHSRSGISTWGRFAAGADFTSDPNHGWLVELSGYLYVCRGRYVQKYEIDATLNSAWSILSTHDLGASILIPGRPWVWRNKLYVPRINTSDVLQPFHELTTVAAEVTEVQTIAISGTPTGGTYTLTFDGKTTAGIAYNADAAAVQAALRLIAGLEQITVATTGGSTPNFTHTITFTAAPSALASASPPQLTSSVAGLTGGTPAIAHNTTTPGTTDTWNVGQNDRLARTFTVNHKGHLVAAMDTNEIRTCDDDPLVSADWAPSTAEGLTIGDNGIAINELVQLLKYTIAIKENGPFSFDEDFYSQPEVPDLKSVRDTENGLGSSYFQGKILMPHRVALVLWDQESFAYVGPNQEDGIEGDLTPGWGRVSGSDVYGKDAFVVANDTLNGVASLWSVSPGGEARPLVWHNLLEEDGIYEDVAVVSVTDAAPVPAQTPPTWASDNANGGTIDWTNASNAADEDNSYAYAGVGTTKYLKGLNPAPAIPDGATILGVRVTVKKSQGVA